MICMNCSICRINGMHHCIMFEISLETRTYSTLTTILPKQNSLKDVTCSNFS